MDWKKEAREKLREYSYKAAGIERASKEIARLESEFGRLRSSAGGGPAGPKTEYDTAMINNIAKREELAQAIAIAQAAVDLVSAALDELPDKEREILQAMYISRGKGTASSLCEKYNIEPSTLYYHRDKALRHFTLSLYGVSES